MLLSPQRVTFLAILVLAGICKSTAAAVEPVPPQGRRMATVGLPNSVTAFGYIETPTRVRCFLRQPDKWSSAALDLKTAILVPGAPLTLFSVQGEDLPAVFTVGADGRFARVVPRKTEPEISVAGEILLPPGADFVEAQRRGRKVHFAIDLRGRLWELDLDAKKQELIEDRADLLLPGGAVRTMPDEANELFLVDRRGNLASYVRDPVVRWKGPRLVGTEFVAGSDLALWRRPDNRRELQIAAVNQRGELIVGRLEPTGWRTLIAPGWLLPPGCPLGVWHTPVNMRFCAVTAQGDLQEIHLRNTEWIASTICEGFPFRSQALFIGGPSAPGIDAAGNLVWSLTTDDSKWRVDVVSPEADVAPARLVRRDWKRPETWQSAEFELANRSAQELTVRVRDRRAPATWRDVTIAPAASVKVAFDQDAPGILADGYLSPANAKKEDEKKRESEESAQESPPPEPPGPDTSRTLPTALQALYDLEVLLPADGVTYVDLREKPWPPVRSRERTTISSGRFALSRAERLPAGSRIDVLQSAIHGRTIYFRP